LGVTEKYFGRRLLFSSPIEYYLWRFVAMKCWSKLKIGVGLGLWLLAYGALTMVKGVVAGAGWVGRLVRRSWLRTALLLGLGMGLLVGLGWVVDSHRKATVCANNLRQLYQALRQYEADTGFLPQELGDLHPTYLPYGSPVLMCPAADGWNAIERRTKTNYIYSCSFRYVPEEAKNDPRSQRAFAWDEEKAQYKERLLFRTSDFPCVGLDWEDENPKEAYPGGWRCRVVAWPGREDVPP